MNGAKPPILSDLHFQIVSARSQVGHLESFVENLLEVVDLINVRANQK